jgi:hypothetical protein
VVCSFCGDTHGDSDNFCPRCGRSPNKKAPYTDFEIGRIAALTTIKKDFWTWFLGAFAALSLLAIFGVNEIIKDEVRDAINSNLLKLQSVADDASKKALQSGAIADLETTKVESTLSDLEGKRATLQKSLDETDQRKVQLEKSAAELGAAEKSLVAASGELEQRENALKKIIDSEDLAKTFAELRNDHYRVRTLRARALYELSQTPAAPILFTLNTISLSKVVPNTNPPAEVPEVQFYQSGLPLALNNPTGTALGSLITYEMYPVFELKVVNRPLTNLDGITQLSLQFGPVKPTLPLTTDSTINNLEELVKLTKKLTIEIELNGTVISSHEFTKDDLRLPTERSSLVSNGSVTFNVTKDVSASYKDVKALYDSLTSAP